MGDISEGSYQLMESMIEEDAQTRSKQQIRTNMERTSYAKIN